MGRSALRTHEGASQIEPGEKGQCDIGSSRAEWRRGHAGGGRGTAVWCEVCEEKPAATILEGHYLCGGCALRSLEEVSDRAGRLKSIDQGEQAEGEPWRLPSLKKKKKE